ncbi:MAG: ChaN family lipoprotein [Elusimicrobia bacterium]|nr:ChaN family lipoprotein [Elusimicrobiota bacterium]
MAFAAVLPAVLAAVAPQSQTSIPPVPAPVSVSIGRAGLFDGATGLPATPAAFLARARAAQVVYAGEKHDSAAHHLAQRDLLEAIQMTSPSASGAFEMLYSSQQGALDDYLGGTTDAAGFQAAVDWPKTWGFPFPLYRPIFELLRNTSHSGAALNVPKKIVSKVSFQGLQSLTPEERAFVPEGFQRPTDAAYLEMLAETYRGHGGDPADPGFPNFVDAMSLWNEGMAAALVRHLNTGAGPVVVVAGAFHAYHSGIPEGVARRLPGARQLSVILLERPDCPAKLDAADLTLSTDYYWVP